MDKLILTRDDVNALLTWRDEHKAEVRSHPVSLRALEILAPEVGWALKGIRDGDTLRLHFNQSGQSFGSCQFQRLPSGFWMSVKNRMKMDKEHLESLLSLYCVVMAVMAYGWPAEPVEKPKELKPTKAVKKNAKSQQKKKPAKPITYILRRSGNVMAAVPKGKHASPRGEFTVRGHYRHYTSGKVVWIAEYRKGTGKKKSKTYKIGGELHGKKTVDAAGREPEHH